MYKMGKENMCCCDKMRFWRINVAFSRARNRIIVIANSKMFLNSGNDQNWVILFTIDEQDYYILSSDEKLN